MRASWVQSRRGQSNVSQMHFARQGVVTEEMVYVARRENLPETLVMEEVARGRMVIPANINHENLEPMAIGIASKCKVNANIGASPNASDAEEEVKKLNLAVKYGADTVMVVGGAEIYRLALPRADRIVLTRVQGEVAGDVIFDLNLVADWTEVSRVEYGAEGVNSHAFAVVELLPPQNG